MTQKGQIPWNKGKRGLQVSTRKGVPRSEETKRKMSKSMKGRIPWNKGKTGIYSEETLKKMSDARIGETAWNKGKKGLYSQSKETREKRSKALKGRTSPMKGRVAWNKGKHLSEKTKDLLRQARAKQIFPINDTSIERMLQEELCRRGIVFEKHIPLLGKYQVDILINRRIIECDGSYWHNYPYGLEKDRIRDKELSEAGYVVHRFWEQEIRENVSDCVDKIIIQGDLL